MSKSIHIAAIEWALEQGYFISVTDEWDIKHSQDRAAIIDAIEGTELPNVWIHQAIGKGASGTVTNYRRVCVFSVIDEGQPDETICNYAPAEGEFNDWFDAEFERRAA